MYTLDGGCVVTIVLMNASVWLDRRVGGKVVSTTKTTARTTEIVSPSSLHQV